MINIAGLSVGDPVLVVHPDLPVPATGTYGGYGGGSAALVRLDGTGAYVSVPCVWIRGAP